MGSTIECFLIEATGRYRVTLRRYCSEFEVRCGADRYSCHNADVYIGEEIVIGVPTSGDNHPHDDQRWPKKCDRCDYVFPESDRWQKNYEEIFVAADGREFTLITHNSLTNDKGMMAPPGAMWRATWLEDYPGCVGPDGQCLVLRTPGGDWHIDGQGPHTNKWSRTGIAPKITASPSILCGKTPDGQWVYHGWLRDGFLVEC